MPNRAKIATPLPLNNTARLTALKRLRLLDSATEANFDRITRQAARSLRVPVCLISLVDDRRQFFKSAHGLGGWAGESRQTPLTHSFCQHVVNSGQSLVIQDAASDPLVSDNLAIPDLGVAAYIGHPINSPDGHVLGSFCAIDSNPRNWQKDELEVLKDFAAMVDTEIKLKSSLIDFHELLIKQQSVLDSMEYGVIGTSTDGLIEVFSKGAEKMLGYSADEVIGLRTPSILHVPEEVQRRADELTQLLGRKIEPGFEVFVALARQGATDQNEWTYVCKDGKRISVNLSVTAIRNELGEVIGFLGVSNDISEKIMTEKALQSTRLQLEATFEAMSEGIVLQDSKGAIVKFNRSAEQILGLSGDQIQGRTSLDPTWACIHEDGSDFAGIDHPSMVTLREGKPLRDIVMGVKKRDGSTTWIEINTELLGSVDSVDRQVVCSFKDATARRLAMKSLNESTRLLNSVINNIPGLVSFWSRDLRNVIANKGYLSWFGRTSEQMKGIHMKELLGPDLFEKNSPYLTNVLSGIPQHFERDLTKVDGGVVHALAHYIPVFLNEGGVTDGFVVLVVDTSESKVKELALKEMAKKLEQQKIALDAHAIVAVTDVRGSITYANDKFCAVSGYSREELIGQNHRILKSGVHAPEFYAELYSVIAQGGIWNGKICNRAKQGHVYWVESTIVPLLGRDGKPSQYIAIRTDITDRIQLEEELSLARDKAMEASRLKSEFLATMSHEIRTPMNAIIGMAGLISDTALSAEQSDMVHTISNGAESLLVIINDILDFSKIEAGKLRLEYGDFDFKKTVEETVNLLAPRAHQKGVEFACEIIQAPDCMVFGDSGRVRQVLMNLIGNGIKFTDEGEVLVSVNVIHQSENMVRMRVDIKDTGIGIPEEAKGRLFNPFEQVDGSDTRRFGGTGLGLAITKQLVEAMEGVINFESVAGRGSTFSVEFSFPRRGPLVADPIYSIKSNCSIMVVDDNETNRLILTRQLAGHGIHCEAFAEGSSALKRLLDKSQPVFDLVLLDWQMPTMGGLELALEIRSVPSLSTIPLVVLSSSGAKNEFKIAGSVGFEAFLSKPVTEFNLMRCIARVLGEASERVVSAATSESLAGTARSKRSFHILLAEDNHSNQLVGKMLLKKMGHTVDVAVNGKVALEMLTQSKFDVVLMDCQMPVLNGYDATRQIRLGIIEGVDPNIPIIALTAYARDQDRELCLRAGMNDYVSKPIRADVLEQALESCGLNFPAQGVPDTQESALHLDKAVLENVKSLPGLLGPHLLPELVEAFLAEEEIRITRMDRLYEARAATKLALESHSFAGNAASVGALRARQIALDLEAAARSENWTRANFLRSELRDSCKILRKELLKLLN